MTIASFIVGYFVLLHGPSHQANAKQQPLCADKSGAFLGLAIDEESYDSVGGQEGEPRSMNHWHRPASEVDPNDTIPTPAQKWILTEEKSDGPKNSIGGKYLQVLPASHRTYPSGHGMDHGKHIMSLGDIDKESPYLSFQLRVKKGGEGWHSLFVRWTGGESSEWKGEGHHHDHGRGDGRDGGKDGGDSKRDGWDGMRPGGCSFYVVMKNKDKIVPGERTIKPAVEPIDSKINTYAGCCFDRHTHVCSCEHVKPDEDKCPDWSFLETERAAQWGKECPVGQGVMDLISAPQWYLFSGKEDTHVMDFADEPWDTTCEADGSYTHHDSGHDFPSWYLDEGDYDLRVYARQDGTALDGIYVAGPDSDAPGITDKYSAGDSTLCPTGSGGILKITGIVMLGLGLSCLLAFVTMTEAGQELAHQGKMMINGVFHRNPIQQESAGGYEPMGQFEVGAFQVS